MGAIAHLLMKARELYIFWPKSQGYVLFHPMPIDQSGLLLYTYHVPLVEGKFASVY